MTLAFSSWSAFFSMGGYGVFVWLALLCALLSLGGIVLHTFLLHRHVLAKIRQQRQREKRIRLAKQKKQADDKSGGSL